ncbi:hypothetical protein [Umezawaea tangerina]|uniref:Uncharacterized protein n=1 Tax=Umezawaea tangerina TaxID=84725 RepID=A0A2T0SMF4_9PSEU|nr:hypothetical protein [Umezawaea tangerina]PRY34597.1 hypothetical protein CLV43_116105 [Umezawaea tangerina]
MTATDPLSHRALALLRATAAGRVELTCSSEPDFRVDNLPCCDQPAARLLVHAGLVEPATTAPFGHWLPAHLTTAGAELLALSTPSAAA